MHAPPHHVAVAIVVIGIAVGVVRITVVVGVVRIAVVVVAIIIGCVVAVASKSSLVVSSAPEQFSLTIIESASRGSRQRVRKLIAFDEETFDKLKQLARDRMGTIQELADEAFADLLRKHGIPVDLKDALRKSASRSKTPAQDNARSSPSRKKRS